MKSFQSFIQSVPHFKGKNFIVRTLYRKLIDQKLEMKISGRNSCTYFLPNIFESIGFEIFVNGVYEPETISFLKEVLPPNGKFADIGGNIGSISIPVCKTRPDIKALAVEAAPWVFNYLERNVHENELTNLRLFNYAIFEKDNLELDFFSPQEKYGKGSLASVFTKKGVKVKTMTLDSLFQQNDFMDINVIKVDVEGFEKPVFKGASEVFSRAAAPVVFFEFVDWAETNAGFKPGDAQMVLKSYGYKLYKFEFGKLVELQNILTSGFANIVARK
jgi:FkbM family methyltransferase